MWGNRLAIATAVRNALVFSMARIPLVFIILPFHKNQNVPTNGK